MSLLCHGAPLAQAFHRRPQTLFSRRALYLSMNLGPLALVLAQAACASAPVSSFGVATPVAAAPRAPSPDDVPASVLDERRRAAEDPTRACQDNDKKSCHWVEVWRRHAVEQLHLPPDWLAAHATVDFILMNDTPEFASFTIQWTVAIDWVKIPIQELVVVRSAPGPSFDSDEAVLARYAALEKGGDGFHVFEIKPLRRIVSKDDAARALATCHGASPAWDGIGFADGKHLVLGGSSELPKPDFYNCIAATVDLETGKLLSCGERVCRQD
jgi:hypothetical protein